jgi:hypothetical protein
MEGMKPRRRSFAFREVGLILAKAVLENVRAQGLKSRRALRVSGRLHQASRICRNGALITDK